MGCRLSKLDYHSGYEDRLRWKVVEGLAPVRRARVEIGPG